MVVQVLEKYIAPDTPGVVVLDPFVGSGTMFRACSQLGFGCVGIELVREHLDPACIVGVHEIKPPDTKKRKHTEILPAGLSLHH
jgi:DNA modification methylase